MLVKTNFQTVVDRNHHSLDLFDLGDTVFCQSCADLLNNCETNNNECQMSSGTAAKKNNENTPLPQSLNFSSNDDSFQACLDDQASNHFASGRVASQPTSFYDSIDNEEDMRLFSTCQVTLSFREQADVNPVSLVENKKKSVARTKKQETNRMAALRYRTRKMQERESLFIECDLCRRKIELIKNKIEQTLIEISSIKTQLLKDTWLSPLFDSDRLIS